MNTQFGAQWVKNPAIAKSGEFGRDVRFMLDRIMNSAEVKRLRIESSDYITLSEKWYGPRTSPDLPVVALNLTIDNQKTKKDDIKLGTNIIQHVMPMSLNQLRELTRFFGLLNSAHTMDQTLRSLNPDLKR